MVFRVCALPYTDEKFSGFAADPATYLQRITQVGMAALIKRAGQPDPWLHRKQHTLLPNDALDLLLSLQRSSIRGRRLWTSNA